MTGSEFAFLAMGVIVGVAAGAVLIVVVRARPRAPREVRVTVAPNAVPRRRAATLANEAFTDSPVAGEPAHGGPADRQSFASVDGAVSSERRTPVLGPRPGTIVQPAFRLTGPAPDPATSHAPGSPGRAVAGQGVPVSSGIDPMLTALRASAAASADAAMAAVAAAVASEAKGNNAATRTGVAAAAVTARAREAPPSKGARAKEAPPAAPGRPTDTPSGPCGETRRLADERCELASRARSGAVEAEEAHLAAQRAYDDHESAIAAAAAATDVRNVRQAKDEAQARFREARANARTQGEIEAAARDWLLDINGINAQTGVATATLQRTRAAAPDLVVQLERTAAAADTARIAAEAAEAACATARQAVADCEQRASGGTPSPAPGKVVDDDENGTSSDALAAALRTGATPRIVRLLRGDRAAMQETVAALGGDDREERRRWQVAISDLVDAILADAIAASALEFPTDHPFWGPFSRAQRRDIAAALSSLGYRFDGIGGWVDGRYPSQRDLSLALGYAGLDPMRMRQWPTEAEMTTLYSDVSVAAAEHVASAAGDMTLGSLVDMLGRRADGLTEIWNAWARIRPVLLDES